MRVYKVRRVSDGFYVVGTKYVAVAYTDKARGRTWTFRAHAERAASRMQTRSTEKFEVVAFDLVEVKDGVGE